MPDNEKPDIPGPQPLKFIRDEEFASLYANNIQFEISAWDLKIIFGELDQSEGTTKVKQHTAITIPWSQVKLVLYFLQANLAIYETQYGFVRVPHDVLPPEPKNVLPKELEGNPATKASIEFINKLHELLVKSSTQAR